jgi:hypothetical protein
MPALDINPEAFGKATAVTIVMSDPNSYDHRAKEIVDIWNARRAAGAEVWMYPTVAAALAAGCPWLHFICTECQQRYAVDLRALERHGGSSISSAIPEIACPQCQRLGEVRLFRLSPTRTIESA